MEELQRTWLAEEAGGARLDPARHHLHFDVKAATLHRFRLQQSARLGGIGDPRHLGRGAVPSPALPLAGAPYGKGGPMLHLDGSRFSGSGTIVRFGVPLAALTGQALHLTNVRARRDPPGLRPQHLQAVEAVTELCQGTLQGGTIGSRELVFHPDRRPHQGSFQWDIGTAGSATMVALGLLPLAAFAQGPLTFQLSGGLFQDFAPSAFHLQHALLPLVRRMGLHADLHILRPGYVPTGGGRIALTVTPVGDVLRPITMP